VTWCEWPDPVFHNNIRCNALDMLCLFLPTLACVATLCVSRSLQPADTLGVVHRLVAGRISSTFIATWWLASSLGFRV
jgi:hypothetical protein